jgi:hypothetical protein
MPFKKGTEVPKARWLIGLEKEREYNRESEDIERRLCAGVSDKVLQVYQTLA